jgi:DNA-binding CsgD family transcriptional regulator
MVKTIVGPIVGGKGWGGRRLPTPVGAGLFSDRTWAVLAVNLKLSARELEIVRGIFNDRKEHAIAAELGISAHTVHTERERLYRKLGINNQVQLMLRLFSEFHALTLDGSTLPPICALRTAGRCPLAL